MGVKRKVLSHSLFRAVILLSLIIYVGYIVISGDVLVIRIVFSHNMNKIFFLL